MRKVIFKNKSVRRLMFPCYLFVAWGNQDASIMENCCHVSPRIPSDISADNDVIEQMEDIYRIEQPSEIGDLILKKTSSIHSRPVKIDFGLLKGMKGRWNHTNGQFNVCLNLAGTRYEIAFDREFVYSDESIAV